MVNAELPDYKKYAKDSGLVVIGRVIGWIEPLILLPILTKALGAGYYGIWAQVNVTISLLAPIALLGLGAAMERFLVVQANRRQVSKSFLSILATVSLTSLLFSILMFILAKPLAATVFGGAQAEPFIRIAAFIVFLAALNSVISQYFVALRQVKWYTTLSIIQVTAEIISFGYLALSGFGLFAILIALLAIRAFLFILGILIIKLQMPLTMPDIATLRPYLVFGLPLLSATICVWLFDLSDRYVIGYFLGASAVGVYSVSYQIGSVVSFFWAPFGVVLLPAIAPLYEQRNLQAVKAYLSHSFKFFLAFAIPASFGLSILSNSILATLTTPEFATGYSVIPLVALAKMVLYTSMFYQTVLMLTKRARSIGFLYVVTAAVNIVMNVILVPWIGILGAAIATLAAFIIHFALLYTLGRKQLSFDTNLKFMVKSLISAMVMGVVIYFLNSEGLINLAIAILVGAIVYFVILILLRGFTRNEYEFLRTLLRIGNRTED